MKRLHLAFRAHHYLGAVFAGTYLVVHTPDNFAGVPWGTTQEQVKNDGRARLAGGGRKRREIILFVHFTGFPSTIYFDFTSRRHDRRNGANRNIH